MTVVYALAVFAAALLLVIFTAESIASEDKRSLWLVPLGCLLMYGMIPMLLLLTTNTSHTRIDNLVMWTKAEIEGAVAGYLCAGLFSLCVLYPVYVGLFLNGYRSGYRRERFQRRNKR